jgi:hypothetical protein
MPSNLEDDLKQAEGDNSPSIAAAVRSALLSPEPEFAPPEEAAPADEGEEDGQVD